MSCTGRSSHGLADIDLLGEAMSETVQLLQHVRRYIEAEPPSSRPKEATLEVLDRAIAALASRAPAGNTSDKEIFIHHFRNVLAVLGDNYIKANLEDALDRYQADLPRRPYPKTNTTVPARSPSGWPGSDQ